MGAFYLLTMRIPQLKIDWIEIKDLEQVELTSGYYFVYGSIHPTSQRHIMVCSWDGRNFELLRDDPNAEPVVVYYPHAYGYTI